MIHARTQLGRSGETLVAQYLKKHGFTIIATNYLQPYGEIDLIAQSADYVLFVEVKMRTSALFDPSEVIVPSKQKKIIKTAQAYLMHHPHLQEKTCRFDVALVEGTTQNPKITYLEDAFHGNG